MSRRIFPWLIAAALSAAPGLAAHAGGYYPYHGGYGQGGYGYEDPGYGDGAYDTGYAGYDEGGDGGFGYGGYGPNSAPAHYCREHLRYHLRQAWLNDNAPYNDWWGAGGPDGWREAMEADHARFHYTHPGSWRCEYQGWPSG